MIRNKAFIASMLYIGFLLLTIASTVITKQVTEICGIEAIQFLFYRTLICLIILTPVAIYKKFIIIKQKDIHFVLSSAVYMLTIYTWYYAVQKISVNELTIIAFLVPMFVNIFAVLFLKEKITKNLWLATLICLITGIVLNYKKLDDFYNYSYMNYTPALMFVILRSIAIVINKNATKKKSPIQMLYYLSLSGVIMIPLVFSILPFRLVKMNNIAWKYETINVIFYLLQMWMMYKAYSMVKVSILQPLDFTKFIFSAIASYLLFTELPTAIQIISAIVIFVVNFTLLRKYYH